MNFLWQCTKGLSCLSFSFSTLEFFNFFFFNIFIESLKFTLKIQNQGKFDNKNPKYKPKIKEKPRIFLPRKITIETVISANYIKKISSKNKEFFFSPHET